MKTSILTALLALTIQAKPSFDLSKAIDERHRRNNQIELLMEQELFAKESDIEKHTKPFFKLDARANDWGEYDTYDTPDFDDMYEPMDWDDMFEPPEPIMVSMTPGAPPTMMMKSPTGGPLVPYSYTPPTIPGMTPPTPPATPPTPPPTPPPVLLQGLLQ